MSNSLATSTTSTNSSPKPSTSSDDSAATASAPSSPPAAEQPTSAKSPPPATTGSSETSIRYEDRIFLAGMTGSGKSELAKQMFLSTAAPRTVIDPADSSLTASVVDEGGTFSDPRRRPDVATARFVPQDPADRDIYDALYESLFKRFPHYVWLDEAGQAAPATAVPRWLNTFVVQGRKRRLGHLACHTRPREVSKNLIAQATHIFVFQLPDPEDRAYIAKVVGLSVPTLEREHAAMPKYGFLWWNVATQTLASCPPLRLS